MTPLLGEPSALLATMAVEDSASKSPPQQSTDGSSSSSRLDQECMNTDISSAKPKQQQRRRVYFVEERNRIHEFQPIDKEDTDLVAALWQQPWEMYECKQSIKTRARQWRSTGLGMLLADTFHSTGDLLQQQQPSIPGIGNTPNNNSSSKQKKRMNPHLCQKQLNTFAQLPDEFYNRGVERYLSRQHDQERTLCKRSILQEIVVQAQNLRRQQRQSNNSNNSQDSSATTRLLQEQQQAAEYLSRFAQQLNRDAALFARRCGRADEVAVRKGTADSPEVAYRLVDYLIELEQEQQRSHAYSSPAVMPTHERPAPPRMTSTVVAAAAVMSSRKKTSPSSMSPSSQQHQQQPQPKGSVTTKVSPSGRRVGLLQARQA